MSNLRQAAQQARDALANARDYIYLLETGEVSWSEEDQLQEIKAAITNLRAALAEPEQEPVAWLWPHQLEELQHIHQLAIRAWSGKRYKPDGLVAVYTAPTPRKPLTDLELRECFTRTNTAEPLAEGWPGLERFARAIERAHGIKEQEP